MNYKDLMLQSLTALLEKGEVLLHPIYGILNQADGQYYGFFGLTQSHLLIALTSGKAITYTTRVPLDLHSVRIRKTRILRQSIIEIRFNEGAPCRITAAPRVATIDLQKENLPAFLEALKSHARVPCAPPMKEIKGERIRWQYFNAPIYLWLTIMLMTCSVTLIAALKSPELDSIYLVDTCFEMLRALLFPLPLPLLLSLFNRFFFGKVIGVMTDEGIWLDEIFYPWHDIQRVAYTPEVSTRRRLRYTYATFYIQRAGGNEFFVNIEHFPRYGLKRIKKYRPEIPTGFSKSGKFTLWILILIPIIATIIISF